MCRYLITDPDMSLAELMTRWPQTIPVFICHKTQCVGCLISPFHTVADACREYALDSEAFCADLIAAIERGS
jgi:hybrid cluster-associated redox disulfide protein